MLFIADKEVLRFFPTHVYLGVSPTVFKGVYSLVSISGLGTLITNLGLDLIKNLDFFYFIWPLYLFKQL